MSTRRSLRISLLVSIVVAAGVLSLTRPAHAAATYIHGRISNVTFAGDYVMIMLDAGLPENCTGSAWGWMKIPPENKPMTAFVMGLWLRGDADQVGLTVYTDGLVGGYCRISQIDPIN